MKSGRARARERERKKSIKISKKKKKKLDPRPRPALVGTHLSPLPSLLVFSPSLSLSRALSRQQQRNHKKQQLPVIALLCFGLYALLSLLLGVATFRDVPEANAGLQKDIAEARRDLARRGVVDVVASD